MAAIENLIAEIERTYAEVHSSSAIPTCWAITSATPTAARKHAELEPGSR